LVAIKGEIIRLEYNTRDKQQGCKPKPRRSGSE
jgi:hypothetical protein